MDAHQCTSLLAAGVSCGRPYAVAAAHTAPAPVNDASQGIATWLCTGFGTPHALPATSICSVYANMQQQHHNTTRATRKAIGGHEVGRPWLL